MAALYWCVQDETFHGRARRYLHVESRIAIPSGLLIGDWVGTCASQGLYSPTEKVSGHSCYGLGSSLCMRIWAGASQSLPNLSRPHLCTVNVFRKTLRRNELSRKNARRQKQQREGNRTAPRMKSKPSLNKANITMNLLALSPQSGMGAHPEAFNLVSML